MTCPHSLKTGPCSSCLGAVPQVVTIQNGAVLIDGSPAGRSVDEEAAKRIEYAKRGNAHGRRPKP